MSALFKQYFYIAFLMGKPQDLPSGNSQMQIGLLLASATYVLAWSGSLGWGGAALLGLLEILGTGLILVVALQLTGKLARFQQAFGGLYGASTFINLAGWPVYVARFNTEGQASAAQGNSDVITEVAMFVLLVWSLSLLAHVIRHTFEVKMFVSILIAYIYFLLWSHVFTTLLPSSLYTLTPPEASLERNVAVTMMYKNNAHSTAGSIQLFNPTLLSDPVAKNINGQDILQIDQLKQGSLELASPLGLVATRTTML